MHKILPSKPIITYTPEYFKDMSSIDLSDRNEVGLTPLMYILSNDLDKLGITVSLEDFNYMLYNSDLNAQDILGSTALSHAIKKIYSNNLHLHLSLPKTLGGIDETVMTYLIQRTDLNLLNIEGDSHLEQMLQYLGQVNTKDFVSDEMLQYLVSHNLDSPRAIMQEGKSTINSLNIFHNANDNNYNLLLNVLSRLGYSKNQEGLPNRLLEKAYFDEIISKTDIDYTTPQGETATNEFIQLMTLLLRDNNRLELYNEIQSHRDIFLNKKAFNSNEFRSFIDYLYNYEYNKKSLTPEETKEFEKKQLFIDKEIKNICSNFCESNSMIIDSALQLLIVNLNNDNKYVSEQLMTKIWENISYEQISYGWLLSKFPAAPMDKNKIKDNTELIKNNFNHFQNKEEKQCFKNLHLHHFVVAFAALNSDVGRQYAKEHIDVNKFEGIFMDLSRPVLMMVNYLRSVYLLNLAPNLKLINALKAQPNYNEAWLEKDSDETSINITLKELGVYEKIKQIYLYDVPALEQKNLLDDNLVNFAPISVIAKSNKI